MVPGKSLLPAALAVSLRRRPAPRRLLSPRRAILTLLFLLLGFSASQASAPSLTDQRTGVDERLWGQPGQPGDRQALLKAMDHSLRYLKTRKASAAYARLKGRTGITRERVRRSLLRFRHLLKTSRSAAELQAKVQREFVLWQPGAGETHFTGYFEPTYAASRKPSATYRYPLYRLPRSFGRWPRPHPTRAELEGADGLHGGAGRLRGQELVWLRDRLEAFLVQVQGSARLRLPDGRIMSVAYAGHTAWPYTSVGRQLVADGKIRWEDLTLQTLIAHFRASPEEMDAYLPRNRRFVFFREASAGAPPRGSLGVPLTPERSIATDKSLLPPGALALLNIRFTNPAAVATWKAPVVTRYVLDQDVGSAIKGRSRVDLFTGTGLHAGERAGVVNATGDLYYLLLK